MQNYVIGHERLRSKHSSSTNQINCFFFKDLVFPNKARLLYMQYRCRAHTYREKTNKDQEGTLKVILPYRAEQTMIDDIFFSNLAVKSA